MVRTGWFGKRRFERAREGSASRDEESVRLDKMICASRKRSAGLS